MKAEPSNTSSAQGSPRISACRLLAARALRRTWAVCTAVAAGAAGLAWNIEMIVFVLWLAVLAVLSWIDLRTLRLPKAVVNPATLISLGALAGLSQRNGDLRRFGIAAAVGAGCYLFFAALHFAKPHDLGFGDVRLAGLNGLFLGWLGPLTALGALVLGAAGASVAALGMLALRKPARRTLAFGPFLAAGAAMAVFFHPDAPVHLLAAPLPAALPPLPTALPPPAA